jgi:hypothetical protein
MTTYPAPNEYGVYVREVCEVAAECWARNPTKRMRASPLARILVVQVGEWHWLDMAEIQFHAGDMRGHGGLPAVGDWISASREEAIEHAAGSLLIEAEDVLVGRSSELCEAQREEARALQAFALEIIHPAPKQLALDLGEPA